MINCKQASQLVSQSLDKPLPWSARLQLKFHLLICKLCSRFYRQMHLIKKMSKQLQANIESNESITLSAAAKQRIQDHVNGQ